MVQRSKRSMSPHKAAEMKKATLAYQMEVRRWAGEIPIHTPVYVAIQALNDSVCLALMQFTAAIDESGGNYLGTGRAGLHDFD